MLRCRCWRIGSESAIISGCWVLHTETPRQWYSRHCFLLCDCPATRSGSRLCGGWPTRMEAAGVRVSRSGRENQRKSWSSSLLTEWIRTPPGPDAIRHAGCACVSGTMKEMPKGQKIRGDLDLGIHQPWNSKHIFREGWSGEEQFRKGREIAWLTRACREAQRSMQQEPESHRTIIIKPIVI